MMSQGTLALPALHPSVPSAVTLRQQNTLVSPLAIALLEANIITAAMLQPQPNMKLVEVFSHPDERALTEKSLSAWWSSIQYPSKHFHWNMHVQQLEDSPAAPGEIFFCLTRSTNSGPPRWTLAKHIMQLEQTLTGFGQTVLALLFDVMEHMPTAFDLTYAYNIARDWHWQDTDSDEELLEIIRNENGYETIQQVIDDDSVITRAVFYKDMPEWATAPKRVQTRAAIAASCTTQFEHDVLAACDAISALACEPTFRLNRHEIGAHCAGADTVDACMVLLWKEHDVNSHVIDQYLENLGSAGEYNEFIDAFPLLPSARAIRRYQKRTECMMRLAQAAERLLDLIGEPY